MTLSIEQALAEPKRSELLQGLYAMGFFIEDMTQYGNDYKGQFRFLNKNCSLDIGYPQGSREDAEDDLLHYAQIDLTDMVYLPEQYKTAEVVKKIADYEALGIKPTPMNQN